MEGQVNSGIILQSSEFHSNIETNLGGTDEHMSERMLEKNGYILITM